MSYAYGTQSMPAIARANASPRGMGAFPVVGKGLGGLPVRPASGLNWTFSVSSALGGFTNPPKKAGMSDGICDVSGVSSWAGTGSGDTVTADFGVPTYVSHAYVRPNLVSGWGAIYINGAILQTSTDGSNWTDVITLSGIADTNALNTYAVATTCRYVRLSKTGWFGVGDFFFD